MLSPAQPVRLAALIAGGFLAVWWVWCLWGAARRSPIRFDEDDAALLCSTPVSRRAVAFTRLLGEWFRTGVAFWALAVTLGFARAEIAVGGKPAWADAPLYLADGMQFLLPVLLLQAGMLALVWAFGCLRLVGDRDRRDFPAYPLLVGLALGAGWITSAGAGNVLAALIAPVMSPIFTGAGLSGAFPGLVIALGWVLLGMAALYLSAPRLNLSRAAQETVSVSAASAAAVTGNRQVADNLKLKERLKGGHAPSRLPAGPGAPVLVWKQMIQFTRGLTLGKVYNWVIVFGLSMGLVLAPDWGTRAVAGLFWILQMQERLSEPLRADLRQWFFFRALPLAPNRKLVADILPPAALAVLLGWTASLLAGLVGLPVSYPGYPFLYPFMVVVVAFAAVFDVLRQARSDQLLIEIAPSPGMAATAISLVMLALNFLLFIELAGSPASVIACAGVDGAAGFALYTACLDGYRKLGA